MHFLTWLDDLRLTVRHAGRARAFYISAVLTLAVGLAGATLMFTLIRGILLRPLPVPDEDRLVVSWRVPPSGLATHIPYRSADVEEIGRASRSFERVTGVGYNGVFDQVWRLGEAPITAKTVVVMGGFFDVAGVQPRLGRALGVEDNRRGAERLVVLSHSAWLRLFNGSPKAIGQTLRLQNHSFTVAGVMPADFEYPGGSEIWTTPHALADIEPNEAFRTGLVRDVEIVGRLRHGVTVRQAADELAAMMAALDARTPGAFVNFRPVVRPFKDVVVRGIDTALAVLFAAVGLILVIASANVANLFLMRGEGRRTELAVRAALGASRSRLAVQLLAESLLAALVAAAVGLGLTRWALHAVVSLAPDGVPRPESIRIDAAVVAFTTGLAFLAAALAGVVPALMASRFDLVGCLRAGGRGTTGAASARGRRLLVAAQVALAVTVVAAAGLLTRSVLRLQAVDMGLAADRLVLAELDVPRDRYADAARRRSFHDEVIARVATAPGIESVTALNVQPFAGVTGWDLPRFTADGQTADQVALNPSLNFEAVYPRYFSTLGVAIIRGREFTAADRDGGPRVAIVSDSLAAATWPGRDPVGKRLKFGGLDSSDEWLTVVGVAATTRYRELVTPRPTLYVPAELFMISGGRLAIRTTAAPAFVAGIVGDAVRAVDPAVGVTRIAPYAEYLRRPLAWPRFNALLLGIFAAAALLLSAIGLYGVMAASVRQRHAEIGVRLALGATTSDVRRLVLGEGLRLALAGAVTGLMLAFVGTRVLRGLLFETEPLDPVSLVAAAVVLIVTAVVATWLPARRATHVHPIEVLRAQ